MTLKLKLMLCAVGMLVSFILCVLAEKSDTWFAVAFVLFLGNLSMFYLLLKSNQKGV